MTSIGSYQAKTTLPTLLQRVAKGERILITRRGIGIAMLVPPQTQTRRDVTEVLAELKTLRAGNARGKSKSPLSGLRHAGHRF